MKNSIFNAVCKTRYLALLVVLIFTCGNAWGTDVTFTVNVESSNTTTMSKGDVTVSTTSGTFSRTDNYRIYANNSMTITSSGGNITQVAFNITQNTFTANVGTWTDNTKTWTGDASSVTFSASGGQVRITSFTVTINSSFSCTECTYYVYNGSTWVSIGTTGFTDVVLAPPTLANNGHAGNNGAWTTDKTIYDGGGCTTYASGNKYRFVPNPGGAAPDADNKPGSGVCELYAVYYDGNGCLSTHITAPVCERIWDEPENLVASVTSSTAATLTWDAIAGVSSYHVVVTKVSGSVSVFDGNVNTNSKSLTGLTAGTEYSWSVAANSSDNDACDSNPTDGDNFTTCASGFTSATPDIEPDENPGKNSCEVLFDCTSATSYTVTLKNNSTNAVITGYNGITNTTGDITFSGLAPSTTYRVEVVAHNACGENSQQGSETFTTAAATLYTVTFVNSAGSAPSAVTQQAEGGTVSIPSTTACDGWNFAGWKVGSSQSSTTSDPTGSGTWITSNSWPKSYTPTGNITVYAVFKQTIGGGSGASAGTTLWSENWDEEDNGAQPSGPTTSGSEVYGSATITYAYGETGTKLYTGTMSAGGSSPELLVVASGGTFSISGIPVAGAATATLTYRTNKSTQLVPSTSTAHVSVGNISGSNPYTRTITFESGVGSTFDLTFTKSSSNNSRLDDISIVVATAGSSGTTTWTSSPDCATSKELTSITIDTYPTRLNYVTGELFDPTGAVVTAHYDDLSTETVTATTTWSPSTALTAGTGQTATASYTEGGVTKTATVTYNVYTPTVQKQDNDGIAIASTPPTVSCTGVSLSASETGNSYKFKEWLITGGTLSDASSLTPTITSVSSAITVTAVYWKPVTVTWYVPSGQYDHATNAHGWSLVHPANPNPATYNCDGKVFVGWTRSSSYSHATDAPEFVNNGTTINSNENLYAVFAEQTNAGTPPTWTKTSLASASAGTYLICNGNGYALASINGNHHGDKTTTAFSSANWANSSFSEAAPLGAMEVTFATKSSGFTMNVAGSGYIVLTDNTVGHIAFAESDDAYWQKQTIAYNDYWRYEKQFSNKYGFLQARDDDFRNYAGGASGNPTTGVPITLLKKTAAGTPATYINYATSCSCEGYSFHTGTGTDDQVKANNTRTCFVQDGTDNNMWKIENYVIPSTTKFFVGYQDEFQNGSSPYDYSVVVQWTDVPTKSNNKWQGQMFLVPVSDVNELNYFAVGQATGAKGTLRVYNNSGDKNKYVNFEPDGYGITYGGSGHAFGAATSNKRETEVVTLPDVSSTTYTVGLATATAGTYVTCAHSKAAENINAMGVSIIEGGKKKILLVPGSFDADGAVYAIWDGTNSAWGDGTTKLMTDVDGDGIWEGVVASTCVKINLVRLSSGTTASNISWDRRWNQTGDINVYDLLNKYTITSLNGNNCAYSTTAIQPATGQKGKFRMWDNSKEQNWFVHFIPYYHLTYDGNGGGDAVTNLPASPADVCSEESDANRTVTVANTDPVRSGYRFMGWADTQAHATAGTVDHAKNSTIVMTGDKTIYAVWKQEYTVTYDLDGGSASPTCDGGSYLQGDDVTVCTSTPGGKAASTFNGWIAFETGNTSNIVTISEGHITMPSHNVTIKATWTEATFVLTQNVGSHTTAGHVGTDISSSMTNAPGLDLTYTITNIPANDDYALPKSITISGGGQTWVLGTNYTWTLSEDKHSATLHIGNNLTISANVTVTITEQTRYTVVWDEHSIRDTVYKAADDNTVTEITVVADCGQKKFYRWTEDGTFVSDDDTPPAAATFGAISGDKHYYAVYADATTPQNPGYVKVTTISAGTYLIANPGGTQKAYQATDAAVSATITDGVISSLPTGATEVTVTLGTGGNAGYFAISYDDNGTEKYLYGGKNSLSATTTERYDWSLGTGTYVGEIISKCTTESKTWYLQNNSSYFRAYAHTQNVAYLYKKQTTTYENFSMTCDTYDITIDNQITGGTVTTTPTAGENAAGAGQPVTVTITPDDCKYLTALVYNDGSDHDILSSKSFTMPAHNVTITATFATKTVSSITPTSSHRMLMQGTSFVGEDIRVTYSNGESEDLIFGDSKLAYTGYNMSSLGNQTVTVTYTGCGSTTTTYSITITDGIVVTFSDCGIATERKYDPGQTVPVESIDGAYGCSGWVFAGWSETSVAANSTSYTPVSNFSASTAKTLYAVYSKEGSTWLSAFDLSEMRSGAKYVIVKNYSSGNQFALTNAADGSAPNYLDGSQLATDCEAVREPGTYNDRYRLTVTPTASMIWVVKQKGEHWTIYSPDANKYLKITSDGYTQLTTACEDEFILTEGYDDSAIDAESTNASGKHLSWYNSSPKYWNGYGSAAAKVYWLTNNEQFSSTPPCAPRSVDFHGNGGQITEYGESPDEGDPVELTVTEATRDAGIHLPSARFADCNGKSWTFVGWSDEEIDVTRIPVLTTDLLEDGVAGASHTITSDDEEYWAVFTNQGNPETKYGTISFVKDNFVQQYSSSEQTLTKTVSTMGDYTFGYVNVGHQSNIGIQFNENEGELYNKTSLGKVNSISFTTFTSGDINKLNVYVGNEEKTTDHLLTAAEMQNVESTWTYYPTDDESFIYITNVGKGNGSHVCVGGISIDFGKGTEVWATTPDCSILTLSGTVKVTSTNGKKVKAVTPITVTGKDLTPSTSITLAAYNVSDDTPNSNFTFIGSVSTNASGDISSTTVTVAYQPTVTTDGIEEVYFRATDGTTNSNKLTGYGRHLPAKFVIATKVGDDWYALPNNISTASYGTRDLIPITVDNTTTPTTATVYTSTTDYLAWNLDVAGTGTGRYSNMGEYLFFSSPINSNRDLAGDAAGLRNSAVASTSSGYEAFAWKPATTDFGNYTLQNGSATTYYVATNGSDKWNTANTGADVRFLIYDKQPAATITWYNDMLGANHTTNYAENGFVTLPTGTDPESCNEPSGLLTFDGWVTATWTGFKTTGFTKVVGGEVATSNTTYYAVFKTGDNKYYTKCPTIYSITYTPNGGTGSNYVTYTMNTTADAVTVGTAGFEKSGSTFVGWTNPSDADGTIITPGAGHITGLSGNITLNAVWIGTVSVTGTVRLTASAGEKVATGATDVTISSTDLACATALRITYKDVTNDVTYGRSGTPSYTSSEFRLCDGSYNVADGSNISLAEVSGSYNQTFSMTYEPNEGANTLDEYQLKVEVLLKNTVIDTKTLSLYGRTLPASFAIAIKVGGSWYALPNNMGSEGTYDPILISVTEDASVLNWAAQGPPTVAYKMKDYTPNYSKLRFAANDATEYCLWAATGNAAGIRNYSASSTDNNYAWTVTSDASFNAYTMANLANTREALKIYNNKWEMYNTVGLSEIHFIPLTTVTPIDVTVMEWGVDEIAVKTVADWSPSAITAQISGGSATTVTKAAIGGDLYKLTGVGDLKGNPGEPLALNITDGGAKQAIIQIPFIVAPVAPATSETKTEADLADLLVSAGHAANRTAARAITKNMDVIVRSGGTLSSSSSTSGEFSNVYIYPGGKADLSRSISIQNIYMRGGYSWLGGAYAHPQLLVASGASISGIGSTNHGIFYDIYLNDDIYYMFALPKTVAVTAITNEENGDDWDAWIKSYSGQGRTLSPKVTGWSYVTSGSIERGKGYEIAIKPRLSRPYGVLRFPLMKSTGWSAEGDCSPEVTGWGANNTNVADNNKGWNIIGNPFLTAYNNTAVPGSDPSGIIQTKTLVEHKPDGVHWDGTYEWATSNVKYFTIPRMTEYEYDDVRAISAGSPVKLEPFFPFFIQVTGDGSVSFNASNRVLKKPSRYAEETPREVMVDFALTNSNGVKDVSGLTISNQYSAGFDMEDKEKTIQNGNASMKVYTLVGEYRTAFNSLPEVAAAQPIPVGYIAPQAGKYDFSLVDGDYSEVEHVWLTDYNKASVVDLLIDDKYEFETEAGAFNERFAFNVILKAKEEPIGSGVDAVVEDYDMPVKFIYQDKMFIRYQGVIYDATGKRVREINR